MPIRDIYGFKHLSHDPNLEVQGYDLITADHLSNIKRGGVCISYKNHLLLKLININFVHKSLTVELNIKDLVNYTTSFPFLLQT